MQQHHSSSSQGKVANDGCVYFVTLCICTSPEKGWPRARWKSHGGHGRRPKGLLGFRADGDPVLVC